MSARDVIKYLSHSIVTVLSTLTLSTVAMAAGYPDHPIRLIVPISAGGATDAVARAYAAEMSTELGQAVIVENMAGANGTLGTQYVKRAKADGYTLLLGTIGTHSVNPFLYKKLPYDAVKDFAPISVLSAVSNVVVVPASSPYHSLSELVDAAHKNPGKLDYGVAVVGSSSQLAVEMFRARAKLDMTTISYNGPAESAIDLIGGRIQLLFDPVINQLGNIRAGKVRALAQTAAQRVPVLPNVPTIAESGYPGFEASGWNGMFAPAGTPADRIAVLLAAIQKASKSPKIQQTFQGEGVTIETSSSPAAFADFLRQDRQKWETVINEAHIRVQ